MQELIEWLEGLEVQTLTDELKSEIIEKVQDLVDEATSEAFHDGYSDAKHDIIEYLTYKM